jgi:hypothetical protein
MTLAQVEDFQLADRSRALVSVATKWDEIATCLTGGPAWMTEPVAEAVLVSMLRPFAHPLIGSEILLDLGRALRDAVNARSTYEVSGFLPDHIDLKYPDGYDREDVEQLLDSDIDSALWPLLSAQAVSCAECRRVKCDVTRWKPVVHGMRCAEHVVVLAGPR